MPAGGVDEYGIEGMSPNYLARNGLGQAHAQFRRQGRTGLHPLKDGRKGGFNVSVKQPDGTVM